MVKAAILFDVVSARALWTTFRMRTQVTTPTTAGPQKVAKLTIEVMKAKKLQGPGGTSTPFSKLMKWKTMYVTESTKSGKMIVVNDHIVPSSENNGLRKTSAGTRAMTQWIRGRKRDTTPGGGHAIRAPFVTTRHSMKPKKLLAKESVQKMRCCRVEATTGMHERDSAKSFAGCVSEEVHVHSLASTSAAPALASAWHWAKRPHPVIAHDRTTGALVMVLSIGVSLLLVPGHLMW